jgi:hypothetical protein
MEFRTWYRGDFTCPEVNDGKTKVEKAGYIPAEEQIRSLMRAGARLQDYRRHAYEFPDGQEVPDGYFDPTREPNFDRVDADKLIVAVDEAFRARGKPQKLIEKENRLSNEPQKDPKNVSNETQKSGEGPDLKA